MSVENFDGDGFGDQPSIIYAFAGGDEIREISRSGYGETGPSPGDVIERDVTRSNPSERLPELELPGRRGLKNDDCGEDIPAFACKECGHPVYVGRTCASPVCERCWPAAVKNKVVRMAGKLEGLRRMLYVRYNERRNIDFNHVVASLPDFLVDSSEPIDRALLILKTLLEKHWGIEGFGAIYHPYRIKPEFRKDQYEHGGEPGDGDMAWKDVLNADNPEKYVKFEPHFHLFFPAVRASFDYSVAEAVEEQTGWLFHRVTKGEDSNVSVEDLEDLVHQLTYCYSHAGVHDWNADRSELTSRMKGELHNCYIPDGIEDECLAIFCDAAPMLLGTQFSNVSEASCDAEISTEDSEMTETGDGEDTDQTHTTEDEQIATDEPSQQTDDETTNGRDGGTEQDEGSDEGDGTVDDGMSSDSTAGRTAASEGGQVSDGGGASSNPSTSSSDSSESEHPSDPAGSDGITDHREECGGDLIPIYRAEPLLDDEDWCRSAAYVSGLRDAVSEWRRRTGGGENLPWISDDTGGDEEYSEVIQGE